MGNSTTFFDYYSISHIFISALLTKIGVKIFGKNLYVPIIIIILTTLFEVYENSDNQIIRYRNIEIKSIGENSYHGDSGLNTAGDMIFNMIGIFIGYCMPDMIFLLIMCILFMIIMATTGPHSIGNAMKFITGQ